MQTEIFNDYKEIGNIIKNAKKPFLCCGKSFEKTDVFEYIMQFNPVVFDNIRPNPRFEDMIMGVELFRSEGCDFMIAAGGGSPMDTAKMIRLMATNDISKALSEPMENNCYPSLFIPTTSGSGSEATKTSVFYLNEVDKFSVHNYDFIPQYVLFDERLLKTVPEYQRKSTCLDALCHSIESYISTKSNGESKEFAKTSISLFFKHKDAYIANEPEGNYGMLMASYFGGKAINIAGTVSAHAMCYPITMNCGTAHGHSVAMCLSKIWDYMLSNNERVNDERGREYVLNTFEELGTIMGGKTARDGLDIFNSVLDEFALEQPKVDESKIKEFASKVNIKKLSTNPTALDINDVEELYRRILL